MPRFRRLPHALAASSLSALVFALHAPTWRLGWRNHDEILFLLTAQCYRPRDYFFVPDVHHLFSSTNLTPWAILSFDFDLALFGLEAGAFHVHQVVDVALIACLSYALLARWCRPLVAWSATLLFLMTSPIATATTALPIRHYLEGAVLALVAALFAAAAPGSGSSARTAWRLAASAAAYAAALTAKEIYAPLPLAIFALTGGSWTRRWQASRLHFLVLGVYLAWRAHMLGGLVGGYRVGDAAVLSLAACLPGGWFLLSSLPKFLFLSPRSGYLLLGALGLLGARAAPDRRHFALGVLLLACAVGPVLPVGLAAKLFGIGFSLRFYMVPAWAICAAFAFAVERQQSRVVRAAAVATALVLAMLAASRVQPFLELYEASTRDDAACVDFALASGADRALELPPSVFTTEALAGAVQLRRARAAGDAAVVLAGPAALPGDFAARKVFVRRDAPSCFVREASRTPALLEQGERVTVASAADLAVDWKADGLAWDLRSPSQLSVDVVVRSATGSFAKRAMPAKGSFLDLRQQLWLYHVTEPAEFFVTWETSGGAVARTPGVAVPSAYFGFRASGGCR